MEANVGDWVRIERDESQWPSSGTWPNYRDKLGRIVTINGVECGVAFQRSGRPICWFLEHELTVIPRPVGAPRIQVERRQPMTV